MRNEPLLAEGDIFVYKLTADRGAAPHVQAGLLSLALCKPHIRQQAKPGDWIIGLGGRSVPDLKNRLIYVAQVNEVLRGGAYYDNRTYHERGDCIYRKTATGYTHRPNPYHDASCMTHDLGEAPAFDRAIVLLSCRFVYFGGKDLMPIDTVQENYDDLPRDYLRHHDEPERKRWEAFIAEVLGRFPLGSHGEPTHPISKPDDKASCATYDAEPLRVLRSCGGC